MSTTDADFTGKTAIVVGGSSGIGRATARVLARHGAHVFIAGRDAARLESVKSEIERAGGRVDAQVLDVRDHEAVTALVEHAVAATGALNIMVNGAGVEHIGNIAEGVPEQWREMFDINVVGLLVGAQAAIRAMRKGGFSGHIVHFGSIAGRSENSGVYGATKAAIHSISASLRTETEDDSIRVVNIIPGAIMTNFVRTFPDDMMNGFLRSLGLEENFHQGDILPEARLAEIQRLASSIVASADDVANAVLYAVSQPIDVNVYEIFVRPPKNIS